MRYCHIKNNNRIRKSQRISESKEKVSIGTSHLTKYGLLSMDNAK